MKLRIGRLVMKYNPAIALSRNCFLGILRLNLFRLSSKLYEHGLKKPGSPLYNKLKKFWDKSGGKWSSFTKAINAGMRISVKRHPTRHKGGVSKVNFTGSYNGFEFDSYDGDMFDSFAPAAAAPAVAAAPLIAKIISLLKSSGIKVDDIAKGFKSLQKKGAEDLVNEHMKDGGTLLTDPETGEPMVVIKSNAVKAPADPEAKKQTTIALVGLLIAAGGLYMASKRRGK